MDEEMIHRRMQIQQGEEPEGNCEMWHYPLWLLLQIRNWIFTLGIEVHSVVIKTLVMIFEKLYCFDVNYAAENETDKLLLAAKKVRRATGTDFVISLVADDFFRSSNTYVGKLRQVLVWLKLAFFFIFVIFYLFFNLYLISYLSLPFI